MVRIVPVCICLLTLTAQVLFVTIDIFLEGSKALFINFFLFLCLGLWDLVLFTVQKIIILLLFFFFKVKQFIDIVVLNYIGIVDYFILVIQEQITLYKRAKQHQNFHNECMQVFYEFISNILNNISSWVYTTGPVQIPLSLSCRRARAWCSLILESKVSWRN